jgi:uncharacterized MAPEG superfamily protein
MTAWVLATLGLFVLQTLLPPTLQYVFAGPGALARLKLALGPRDSPPPMPPMAMRAARALRNMQEALPVFLGLAVLHVARGTSSDLAVRGAAVFFVARCIYVPAYLAGVFGMRSAIWCISWCGLVMMIAPLL